MTPRAGCCVVLFILSTELDWYNELTKFEKVRKNTEDRIVGDSLKIYSMDAEDTSREL